MLDNQATYLFFDTHCHFDGLLRRSGENYDIALSKLSKNGVAKLMMPSITKESFQNLEQLSHRFFDVLSYGVGLHPLFIEQHSIEDLDILEKHLAKQDPLCVSVAEIGLERAVESLLTDKNWRKQSHFLEVQLDLAKKFSLPVNMHSRRSNDHLAIFLKKAKLNKTGVVHAFSGSYEQAKRFIDLGYFIGVGGTITFPRANKTRQCIAKLPLDSLVLETDSPDMPLMGFQGEVNRPERVVQVFQTLCELRSESEAEIAETIWQTSQQLFNF